MYLNMNHIRKKIILIDLDETITSYSDKVIFKLDKYLKDDMIPSDKWTYIKKYLKKRT